MNCDQVFDILTRGPFPTGADCDAEVESHLNGCAECRRLAEALRPALELFQEAVDPQESRDLPGYWCAVATDRKPPVLSYAAEPARRAITRAEAPESRESAWSAVTMGRIAAAMILGIILGSLAGAGVTFDDETTAPAATAAASANGEDRPGEMTVAERIQLAVLPAACSRNRPAKGPRYSVRGDQLLARADLGNLACCSECHNSTSDIVPSAATAKVAQHCQTCHAAK